MRAWEDYKQTFRNEDAMSALARQGDAQELLRLIAAGESVNAKDHKGHSPLMLAAYHGLSDAVLPAAGFDDCEHRFIPSCSIPASDVSHAGFCPGRLFGQSLWIRFSRGSGANPSKSRKNKRREKSRSGCGDL